MLLRLQAIKFNHDSSSATVDAFNIRKNEKEPVGVPEWCGVSINPKDSPAAYALEETRNNTLIIQASVSCGDENVPQVCIRALDANFHQEPVSGSNLSVKERELLQTLSPNPMGNILGEVEEKKVELVGGESGFQPFNLGKVRIWDTGVAVENIVWRWQYRVGESDDWIDLAVTTHRIYTALQLPKPPWQPTSQNPSETHLPWIEVMEHACDWARGAQNTDNAAEMITRRVHELGPKVIHYAPNGSTHYTDRRTFDCSSFLGRLRDEIGNGECVNCGDCAAIVLTFANVIGCDLTQLCIRPVTQSEFGLKPHVLIGVLDVQTDRAFSNHQVAAEGCNENSEVFDACLKIETVGLPSIFTLATNLSFGGQMGYRSLLVLDQDQPMTLPHPNCKRRSLGVATGFPETCTDPVILQRHFDFASWRESTSIGRGLFVSDMFLPNYILSDLQLARLQQSDPRTAPSTIQSFWTGIAGEETLLRIDVYETASWQAAREGVMKILTTLERLALKRRETDVIGDVTFSDQALEEILFAVSNLVFFLRNVGSKSVPIIELAQSISEQILGPPPGIIEDPGQPGTVRRFKFVTNQAAVGFDVKLEEQTADAFAPRRFYQFISDAGEVSLKGTELMYRPRLAGDHKLEIFATDAQGNAVRQTLPLHVTQLP